jgi:hypothetical protein
MMGFEPIPRFSRERILSPLRLPFRHIGAATGRTLNALRPKTKANDTVFHIMLLQYYGQPRRVREVHHIFLGSGRCSWCKNKARMLKSIFSKWITMKNSFSCLAAVSIWLLAADCRNVSQTLVKNNSGLVKANG